MTACNKIQLTLVKPPDGTIRIAVTYVDNEEREPHYLRSTVQMLDGNPLYSVALAATEASQSVARDDDGLLWPNESIALAALETARGVARMVRA